MGAERRKWTRLPLAIPVFVRSRDDKGKELLEFATADHSLYYVLADLLVIHAYSIGARKWWRLVPWAIIALLSIVPHIFGNALAIYFLYSLSGSTLLCGVIMAFLIFCYWSFGDAMRPEIGRWSVSVFIILFVMLAGTAFLFWWDPLAAQPERLSKLGASIIANAA